MSRPDPNSRYRLLFRCFTLSLALRTFTFPLHIYQASQGVSTFEVPINNTELWFCINVIVSATKQSLKRRGRDPLSHSLYCWTSACHTDNLQHGVLIHLSRSCVLHSLLPGQVPLYGLFGMICVGNCTSCSPCVIQAQREQNADVEQCGICEHVNAASFQSDTDAACFPRLCQCFPIHPPLTRSDGGGRDSLRNLSLGEGAKYFGVFKIRWYFSTSFRTLFGTFSACACRYKMSRSNQLQVRRGRDAIQRNTEESSKPFSDGNSSFD